MRRSSENAPSFVSGTLKSTRTNTLRPFTSRSRIVCLGKGGILVGPFKAGSAQLGNPGDQVGGAARVAPLIVVPGDRLDQVAADDQRLVGREDARVRVADDVARDQRIRGVFEDTLERPIGGGLHRDV